MEYLEHTATSGEMWDSVALKYYGDEMKASLLLEHNQGLIDKVTFDGGERIRVPVIEESETLDSLPPWRR